MTAEEFVARWAGADKEKIGGHDLNTIRDELWPWLLERGYATDEDTGTPRAVPGAGRSAEPGRSPPAWPTPSAPLEPGAGRRARSRRRARPADPDGRKAAIVDAIGRSPADGGQRLWPGDENGGVAPPAALVLGFPAVPHNHLVVANHEAVAVWLSVQVIPRLDESQLMVPDTDTTRSPNPSAGRAARRRRELVWCHSR